MNDIQPGDVVVCVALFKPANPGFPPIETLLSIGGTYRVAGVRPSRVSKQPILLIQGIEPWGFEGRRFRKIRPASEEFTRHIRALKPVKEDA